MRKFRVFRKNDTVDVAIMPHKDGSGYGFVNLTKGHVCKCRFPTIEEAIHDMDRDPEVLQYDEIREVTI